jgi:hypothetical protein
VEIVRMEMMWLACRMAVINVDGVVIRRTCKS